MVNLYKNIYLYDKYMNIDKRAEIYAYSKPKAVIKSNYNQNVKPKTK